MSAFHAYLLVILFPSGALVATGAAILTEPHGRVLGWTAIGLGLLFATLGATTGI